MNGGEGRTKPKVGIDEVRNASFEVVIQLRPLVGLLVIVATG